MENEDEYAYRKHFGYSPSSSSYESDSNDSDESCDGKPPPKIYINNIVKVLPKGKFVIDNSGDNLSNTNDEEVYTASSTSCNEIELKNLQESANLEKRNKTKLLVNKINGTTQVKLPKNNLYSESIAQNSLNCAIPKYCKTCAQILPNVSNIRTWENPSESDIPTVEFNELEITETEKPLTSVKDYGISSLFFNGKKYSQTHVETNADVITISNVPQFKRRISFLNPQLQKHFKFENVAKIDELTAFFSVGDFFIAKSPKKTETSKLLVNKTTDKNIEKEKTWANVLFNSLQTAKTSNANLLLQQNSGTSSKTKKKTTTSKTNLTPQQNCGKASKTKKKTTTSNAVLTPQQNSGKSSKTTKKSTSNAIFTPQQNSGKSSKTKKNTTPSNANLTPQQNSGRSSKTKKKTTPSNANLTPQQNSGKSSKTTKKSTSNAILTPQQNSGKSSKTKKKTTTSNANLMPQQNSGKSSKTKMKTAQKSLKDSKLENRSNQLQLKNFISPQLLTVIEQDKFANGPLVNNGSTNNKRVRKISSKTSLPIDVIKSKNISIQQDIYETKPGKNENSALFWVENKDKNISTIQTMSSLISSEMQQKDFENAQAITESCIQQEDDHIFKTIYLKNGKEKDINTNNFDEIKVNEKVLLSKNIDNNEIEETEKVCTLDYMKEGNKDNGPHFMELTAINDQPSVFNLADNEWAVEDQTYEISSSSIVCESDSDMKVEDFDVTKYCVEQNLEQNVDVEFLNTADVKKVTEKNSRGHTNDVDAKGDEFSGKPTIYNAMGTSEQDCYLDHNKDCQLINEVNSLDNCEHLSTDPNGLLTNINEIERLGVLKESAEQIPKSKVKKKKNNYNFIESPASNLDNPFVVNLVNQEWSVIETGPEVNEKGEHDITTFEELVIEKTDSENVKYLNQTKTGVIQKVQSNEVHNTTNAIKDTVTMQDNCTVPIEETNACFKVKIEEENVLKIENNGRIEEVKNSGKKSKKRKKSKAVGNNQVNHKDNESFNELVEVSEMNGNKKLEQSFTFDCETKKSCEINKNNSSAIDDSDIQKYPHGMKNSFTVDNVQCDSLTSCASEDPPIIEMNVLNIDEITESTTMDDKKEDKLEMRKETNRTVENNQLTEKVIDKKLENSPLIKKPSCEQKICREDDPEETNTEDKNEIASIVIATMALCEAVNYKNKLSDTDTKKQGKRRKKRKKKSVVENQLEHLIEIEKGLSDSKSTVLEESGSQLTVKEKKKKTLKSEENHDSKTSENLIPLITTEELSNNNCNVEENTFVPTDSKKPFDEMDVSTSKTPQWRICFPTKGIIHGQQHLTCLTIEPVWNWNLLRKKRRQIKPPIKKITDNMFENFLTNILKSNENIPKKQNSPHTSFQKKNITEKVDQMFKDIYILRSNENIPKEHNSPHNSFQKKNLTETVDQMFKDFYILRSNESIPKKHNSPQTSFQKKNISEKVDQMFKDFLSHSLNPELPDSIQYSEVNNIDTSTSNDNIRNVFVQKDNDPLKTECEPIVQKSTSSISCNTKHEEMLNVPSFTGSVNLENNFEENCDETTVEESIEEQCEENNQYSLNPELPNNSLWSEENILYDIDTSASNDNLRRFLLGIDCESLKTVNSPTSANSLTSSNNSVEHCDRTIVESCQEIECGDNNDCAEIYFSISEDEQSFESLSDENIIHKNFQVPSVDSNLNLTSNISLNLSDNERNNQKLLKFMNQMSVLMSPKSKEACQDVIKAMTKINDETITKKQGTNSDTDRLPEHISKIPAEISDNSLTSVHTSNWPEMQSIFEDSFQQNKESVLYKNEKHLTADTQDVSKAASKKCVIS